MNKKYILPLAILFVFVTCITVIAQSIVVGDLTDAVATPYSPSCYNRSVDSFVLHNYYGNSMYPLFVPGDRVFVLETNDTSRLLPRVLVVADHPLYGLVLHKVSSVDKVTGDFTLRGVANSVDDSYLYRRVDFVGYVCGTLNGYR